VKSEEIVTTEAVNDMFPSLPWFLSGGTVRPTHVAVNSTGHMAGRLFPEEHPGTDRITDQLMFLPPSGDIPSNQEDVSVPLKTILMWNGLSSWGKVRPGRGEFIKQECPVSTCAIVTDRSQAEQSDMVLFKDHFSLPQFKRPTSQIWMIFMLECPAHTQLFSKHDIFNWTATYRSDSTIVTPYERWHSYVANIKTVPQEMNFAANKTKQVAWFVSNCGARNGRLQYAQELAQYIGVDIYGACGSLKCPRSSTGSCFDMLDKDYKFYLAFENSNCQDYITEKFFVNGLGHSVLPIVMGARPEDYEKAAPYKSYIHVDQFKGPKEMAEYLIELDNDDQKYNEYFQWKGSGEFINTRFFCRVCALLHDSQPRPQEVMSYSDMNTWWRGEGVCANSGWRLEREMKEERRREEEEKLLKAKNKPT